ncbi:hypothetical protein [Clostridium minihomine]|nr:hypothetical protein [Clostridium minihomine]
MNFKSYWLKLERFYEVKTAYHIQISSVNSITASFQSRCKGIA